MSRPHDTRRPAEAAESELGNKSQSDTAAPESSALEDAGPRQETEKIGRLEAELEELRQSFVRRQADFENYRKRVERERREDRERALVHLAESLLPVLDNFERALAAHQDPAYADYRRGFAMIHRQLADLLAQSGVVRMPDPTGQPFDPRQHHALDRVETSAVPDGTVVGEVQAGYKFHDRVLRPAQVRVAAGDSGRGAESPEVN